MMFRKFIALALCLMMAFSSVSATGSAVAASSGQETLFPKVHTYTAFSDTGSHWALPYVKLCYETNLMQGQGGGRFAPDVSISNAEIAMLAARIHAAIYGGTFETNTTPWYTGAISYLKANGISVGSPNANATRQGFFRMLSATLPDSMLLPINSITMLPDTKDPAVLRFYNAGILTGVDQFGTFDGAKPLSRGECAAMVARVVDPSLRRSFTPAGQVPASPFPDDAVVFSVNGINVSFLIFSDTMVSLIDETQALYADYGLIFDWNDSYGVDNWSHFFKEATLHSLAAEMIATQKAKDLNCRTDELALALFGTPTQAELDAYAAKNDISIISPDATDALTELVLEEKLNAQLGKWVDSAQIVTTETYDKLEPKELWELYR